MNLLVACAVCLWLAASAVPAQTTNAPDPEAQRRFAAGLLKQSEADLAVTGPEAAALYRAAVEEYDAATRRWPEFYDAHLNWAMCLIQIGTLAPAADERNRTLMDANQRFAVAARCRGADYVVFQEWAGLLIETIYELVVDQSHRVTVLKEVRDVCERGLRIAAEPTPRAELEGLLGSALMMLAEFAHDPDEQRAHLTEAINHLRTAQQSVTVRDRLYQTGNLGIALLSLGRFINSPALLREAAAECAAARQAYPNNVSTCYNLAATWSMLGDPEQAARFLALAIDQDPTGTYLRLAAEDPDLEAVRRTEAFAAAVDRRRRQSAEARAAVLFSQAVIRFRAANHTRDLDVLTRQLQETAAACEQVIALTPESFPAHALAADALVRLANLCPHGSAEQRRLAAAAQARFSSATKCPGADGGVYQQWGRFLVHDQYRSLAAGPERDAVLEQARQVLQEGIKRARFTEMRGTLEMDLGICLVLLAQTSTTIADRTPLYVEATRRFQAAAATHSVDDAADLYETWGVALLRAGQAKKDSLLLRQAAERLSKSLDLAPRNAVVHYHLAGAYAQLRQPDLALRHLQTSFDLDPQTPLRQAAQQDPALEPLRRTDSYRRLFVTEGRPPRLPPPKISEN